MTNKIKLSYEQPKKLHDMLQEVVEHHNAQFRLCKTLVALFDINAYSYATAYQLYLPDKALLQQKLKEWIEEFNEMKGREDK